MRASVKCAAAVVVRALLLAAGVCNAVYIPLDDTPTAYPLLRRVGESEPIRWASGELAALRLGANAVRVSDRGVRFVPANMPLYFWDYSTTTNDSTACHGRPGAFCATPGGTLLFPESAADARIAGDAALVDDALGRHIAETEGCERNAARGIDYTTTYAVTLCDVTQKSFSFLMARGRVRAARLGDEMWYYALVCVAVVVLVTCLAQNIASLLEDATPPGNLAVELGAALLLPAISWYRLSLVTTGDVIFHWYSFFYVLLGTGLWAAAKPADRRGAPINVLLGALLHALCRVYDGIESEYVTPLLFLVLVRAFHKAQRQDNNILAYMSVLADFALAGLAHQFGFRALFAQGRVADLFFAVLALAAYSLCGMLAEPTF